jgi:hypothetical protein
MLYCLLDHKAQEHFFEGIDAPTLQLSIELLMRNIEKICPWLGMVKPEHIRKGSRHEDLKGDTVALAKLLTALVQFDGNMFSLSHESFMPFACGKFRPPTAAFRSLPKRQRGLLGS